MYQCKSDVHGYLSDQKEDCVYADYDLIETKKTFKIFLTYDFLQKINR